MLYQHVSTLTEMGRVIFFNGGGAAIIRWKETPICKIKYNMLTGFRATRSVRCL